MTKTIGAVQYSTGTWMGMIDGKVCCTHDHHTKSEAIKCAKDKSKKLGVINKIKKRETKVKKADVPIKKKVSNAPVVVSITKADVKKATTIADSIGKLKNSIRKGAGNLVGALGEVIVRKFIKGKQDNTYDYDLMKKNGRLEVKTKECTCPPEPHYNCTVAACNTKQDCDFYVFVRVLKELDKAWILGFIDKETFYKKSYFGKKGEIDPNSNMNWKFRADCYNIRIDQLLPISELDDYLGRL